MNKTNLLSLCVFFTLTNIYNIASAETISYACSFLVYASPKGLKTETKPFELRYVVDRSATKAYLVGNAGSSEVTEIANVEGVSFVEITTTGNIMVTAITTNGDAVHSRNGIFTNELIPTQYYGKCKKQ